MKKIFIFFAVMTFMFSFVAAGNNDTIVKAADRIVNLQHTDGSWDWKVTGDNGPTGTTFLNIAGVTGQILLDAYELTGDFTYLNASMKTGNYLISQLNSLPDEQEFNAFNIVFLQHLSQISLNNTYSDFAEEKMDDLINKVSFWKDSSNNQHPICGGNGCTAQELINDDENVIRSSSSPSGIVVWDMYNFIEAAQTAGYSSFASDMANEIDNYMSQPNFNNTMDYYILGLSGGIIGLNYAGMNTTSYASNLISEQDSYGSFDGWIQDTAYALMALKTSGETEAVSKASSYLLSTFGYDDGNHFDGWLDDESEYSEVTSEAAQALYDAIGSETQVEGILGDFFWSISVTPNPLSFGTIPRGGNIAHPATNGPVNVYTTGSDTEDNNVYVTINVVETGSFYVDLLHLKDGSSWILADNYTLIIPENNVALYDAELQGSTLNIAPGPKSATIVYTAYGESL